ncbi:hypothetical protein RUA4292_01114 [Ruegeria atlantica]|uniref:DDE domain-containing protein n=1 Tax=Ruegeria atlantica TaxID=81569 RepID=A0A0P1EYN3_9RHOB|nr:hypothetical protein RUA4292_01114 [Ruegeria atlantica]
MGGRGVRLAHTILNRWVAIFSSLIAARVLVKKQPAPMSWRLDDTYVRVRGNWMYLYRAVDKIGNTLDFILSERRNSPRSIRLICQSAAHKWDSGQDRD